MKKLWLLLFVLLPLVGKGQNITTVAGNGATVFSGHGVPATSAGIPNPIGGTFDKYGNYYFADAVNSNRIRKISPLGIISTVAGNGMGGFSGDGGPATAAKLLLPTAVKLDTLGNIYISDANNHRIRKVDAITNIITTIAGNGTGGYSGDNIPATAASLFSPNDICFDKWGNLYIADNQNWRVRKIAPTGIITTFAGTGITGSSGDGGPATLAQLSIPSGIAADDFGNIYIADRGYYGNCVRKVNLTGIISTVAGNGSPTYIGDGIAATAAQIVPIKIGFDTSSQLFIADDYNERVYKVDATGIIHVVAGTGISGHSGDGGPATAADILYPSGIAFDPCGNLYIPVVTPRHIRKVTFNPSCNPTLETKQIIPITEISISPNPTITQLTIFAPGKIKEALVYNLHGQITARSAWSGVREASINVSQLPPGTYLLRIIMEDGNVVVRRFVKE